MVAAAIRTIFAQPDAAHVREQLDTIAGMLGRQLPKVETMLRDATPTSPPSPTSRSRAEKGLEHQPAGTGQQRDQTPHRRRRGLPQPRCPTAPGRIGPNRDPQRMARYP